MLWRGSCARDVKKVVCVVRLVAAVESVRERGVGVETDGVRGRSRGEMEFTVDS